MARSPELEILLESSDFAEVAGLGRVLTAAKIIFQSVRVPHAEAPGEPKKRVLVYPDDLERSRAILQDLQRRRKNLESAGAKASASGRGYADWHWSGIIDDALDFGGD